MLTLRPTRGAPTAALAPWLPCSGSHSTRCIRIWRNSTRSDTPEPVDDARRASESRRRARVASRQAWSVPELWTRAGAVGRAVDEAGRSTSRSLPTHALGWRGDVPDRAVSDPHDVEIFDINAMCVGGWIDLPQWSTQLVPWLLKQCEPKATGGWWLTHAVEIRR